LAEANWQGSGFSNSGEAKKAEKTRWEMSETSEPMTTLSLCVPLFSRTQGNRISHPVVFADSTAMQKTFEYNV